MWNDGKISVRVTEMTGVKIGAYIDFGAGAFDSQVELSVAISFVSVEQV